MFSRRELLAMSAAGAVMTTAQAASFGNPDQPPQGAINGKGPGNLIDPGPQNPIIGNQFPAAQSPPPTDVGGMPLDWASISAIMSRTPAIRICSSSGSSARRVTKRCRCPIG